MLVNSVLLSALAGLAAAQFPPKPEGVKIVKSKLHENVTISYKEVSFRLSLKCTEMLIRMSM